MVAVGQPQMSRLCVVSISCIECVIVFVCVTVPTYGMINARNLNIDTQSNRASKCVHKMGRDNDETEREKNNLKNEIRNVRFPIPFHFYVVSFLIGT